VRSEVKKTSCVFK